MKSIIGRKIELLPHEPKENQILCSVCGGTGWVQDDNEKYISQCSHCYNGVVDVCPRCGKPYEFRYNHTCKNSECMKIEREIKENQHLENEKLRIQRAEKLESNGCFDRFHMLYSDFVTDNEGYFDDWDSFFGAWEDVVYENDGVETERPEYVWGTSCTQISMDADTIIEQATDELWEGARDNCDCKGLQELLDKWCSEQSGTSTYYVNYKYAIKIPWEIYNN